MVKIKFKTNIDTDHWLVCKFQSHLIFNNFRHTAASVNTIHKSVFKEILTLSPMGRGAVQNSLWFFALYSNNLQATHTWKFLTFPDFLLRIRVNIYPVADAPLKKQFKNFVLSLLRALLGSPIKKYFLKFFCFNQKTILQP